MTKGSREQQISQSLVEKINRKPVKKKSIQLNSLIFLSQKIHIVVSQINQVQDDLQVNAEFLGNRNMKKKNKMGKMNLAGGSWEDKVISRMRILSEENSLNEK